MPKASKINKEVKGQVSIKEMMTKSPIGGGTEESENAENRDPNIPEDKPAAPKGKKKALEDIYQKKTQLEHILLRPDTYIGCVEKNTELMWVLDKEKETILQKEVTYVPGLYKIFDEILVNAADHKQRDPSMDAIKVEINQEENIISVWNNGKGIPVSMHKGENMFVPTMIFGHLLTSSNYDDAEEKVTGGRNGYGAKLCNIFSTKFVVETSCKEFKKSFKQAWANNMSKASDPKIKEFTGSEFTKITFSPDLEKFKMTSLDDDIVSIMSRRAYDIAASSKGVKVFLNGNRIPIKSFKDYVDLYIKDKEDDAGNQIKCAYERVNDRWEIAVALSDKGFQQMSFVNSIATTKGGRHVEYVTDKIVKNLIENLAKKKNKIGISVKPFQVKNHLWVFVNALIVNPTFDSQTKENMTLQSKSFGSTCSPSEKFITAVSKCGIVESVLTWAKFKQQAQLQSKCAGKKQNKIKGIPKLEDANDAGTKHSSQCTLILTEGDSAKTLAVAGLGVVGRDRYGVFPLKGKLLNVREASHKQILENAEINNVIKILGLQYKKKYDTTEDLNSLRYGKLMIMTDQDHDGSHIKGLLINFIHFNWPTLLKRNFLEEFITPIVKATKGKEEHPFYSIPEFEEWKKSKNNWHTYKIKYYKGLGTSTSKEAKEYFRDMVRHRILFKHDGNHDDHAITLAFSKKAIEERKEWLTNWMDECRRRKELGLPDIYLYEKDTKSVNYTDFVNKELVLYSNLDNERSIPSLVDGLKPGQRKILYTCFKRNDKKEIKVAQLAGSVAEHSAYHHGEASLMSTIINLAQNYVGSNNINLLKPIGQFGTRLQGGKDSASPRYIFTQLSPLARYIFHIHDEPILNFLKDDNQKIEPEWYIPIIPMVLVNGAEGIGTAWSTKVPNYDPREIVMNIKRMIDGEEPLPMKPWYKNFLGTIEEIEFQRYQVSGEVGKLTQNKYEITELPIRTWTQAYKESVMEALSLGSESAPALISEYKEYHTDTTVRFVVSVPEDKVGRVDNEGPHKIFKLQSTMSLGSMVLFDSNGVVTKYDTVLDIMKEFFDLRLKYYGKRKTYLVGMLNAEAVKLSNQARFILEKCDGRLTVENKKKKDMVEELERKGYDSDPVKAWKLAQSKDSALDEDEREEEESETPAGGNDFDYLLGMTMWTLTKEKKDELLKKKEEKTQELEDLKKKSPSDLWNDDLDLFLEELEKVEKQEMEDENAGNKKAQGSKGPGKKGSKVKQEVFPTPTANRIQPPKIDPKLKKKTEGEKGKRGRKIKMEVANDEFDEIVEANTKKTLAQRVGSPQDIENNAKKLKKESSLKQSKLNFKPKPKAKVTFSSDSEIEDGSDLEIMDVDVSPRERAGGRRAAATKAKYNFSDGGNSSDSDSDNLSLHSNEGVEEKVPVTQNLSFNESLKEEEAKPKAPQSKVIDVSDTDSEFEDEKVEPKKKKNEKPKATEPAKLVSDSDDSEEELGLAERLKAKISSKSNKEAKGSSVAATKKAPPKRGPKKGTTLKRKASSSDSDDMFDKVKKKKGGAIKKDEDFEIDIDEEVAPRKASGRSKKPTKYAFHSDSDSDY